MEKYKSNLINDADIFIKIGKRWIDEKRIEIIEIKHLPSGLVYSSEDKSQVKAYNQALKELEKMFKSS